MSFFRSKVYSVFIVCFVIGVWVGNAPSVYAQQEGAASGEQNARYVLLESGKTLAAPQLMLPPAGTRVPSRLSLADTTVSLGDVHALQTHRGYYRVRTRVRPVKERIRTRMGVKTVRKDSLTYSLVDRRVTGRLDLYAAYGDEESEMPHDHFAKNDGRLWPVEYNRLHDAMQDDPVSLDVLERSKRWLQVRNGMWIGGGLAVIGSLAFGIQREREFDVFENLKSDRIVFVGEIPLAIGMGVLLAGIVPHQKVKHRFKDAIRTYNTRAASQSYRYPTVPPETQATR